MKYSTVCQGSLPNSRRRYLCLWKWKYEHGKLKSRIRKKWKHQAGDNSSCQVVRKKKEAYDPPFWLLGAHTIKLVRAYPWQLVAGVSDKKETLSEIPSYYIEIASIGQGLQIACLKSSTKFRDSTQQHFRYWLDWSQAVSIWSSPDAEPSAARLAEYDEYIKKNKISYIWRECLSSVP